MRKERKPGLFDVAIEACGYYAKAFRDGFLNKQDQAELRAAIRVLKACGKAHVCFDGLMEQNDNDAILRAILAARKVAERKNK